LYIPHAPILMTFHLHFRRKTLVFHVIEKTIREQIDIYHSRYNLSMLFKHSLVFLKNYLISYFESAQNSVISCLNVKCFNFILWKNYRDKFKFSRTIPQYIILTCCLTVVYNDPHLICIGYKIWIVGLINKRLFYFHSIKSQVPGAWVCAV